MNESVRISIKRIREWGPNSPMLHNDALKVADALEALEAHHAGDITSDPEYQAFVEEQAKYCRCSHDSPCAGVLAGGMCDDIQLDEDEDGCLR